MMRKFSLFVGVLGLVLSGPAQASSITTLTFDALPTGFITPFTEAGYSITWGNYPNLTYGLALQNVGGANQNVVIDGTPSNPYGSGLKITRADGNLFSVVSLDIADLIGTSSPLTPSANSCSNLIPLQMHIEGAGGGCTRYTPNSSVFATVSPPGLDNISEFSVGMITFGGQTSALDNIVLSASVPEPTTGLLLGLGLLGVAARRRA